MTVTALVIVAGCASPGPSTIAGNATVDCAVTLPNGVGPPGENPGDDHYGNGQIGTVLWTDGIVRASQAQVDPDGAIRMKFPWWRADGVVGPLVLEGRRLDGASSPMRADTSGYGDAGFNASDLTFPIEGCWEVTAHVGAAELSFITQVIGPGTSASVSLTP
jgi:hypothetical protein